MNSEELFSKLDCLALKKEAFFFAVDYELNQGLLHTQSHPHEGLYWVFPGSSYPENQSARSPVTLPKTPLSLTSEPVPFSTYKTGFLHIRNEILKGNSYLANYTCKTPVFINWDEPDIFHFSQAKYKVRLQGKFMCFSPETFIRITGDVISTEPMKGTIDAAVPNATHVLKNDPKELAEHYTVVDLLRNDLHSVAKNVEVAEFQNLTRINTHLGSILGMSSLIKGVLKPDFHDKPGSILREILPAGSILGAPKKRTAEIIAEAEGAERGYYTGIAGYYDGQNLDTCVMIRFLERDQGQWYFRSGGGITSQSDAEAEYQEMMRKIYIPIHVPGVH